MWGLSWVELGGGGRKKRKGGKEKKFLKLGLVQGRFSYRDGPHGFLDGPMENPGWPCKKFVFRTVIITCVLCCVIGNVSVLFLCFGGSYVFEPMGSPNRVWLECCS